MSGREAYNYLSRTGAVKFITDCWEGLHMTGPLYIIDSIDEYIANHAEEIWLSYNRHKTAEALI
jgi:hypothetical protein